MSAPVDVRAWLANRVTREREIERATGLPNSERAAAESVCAAVDELIGALKRARDELSDLNSAYGAESVDQVIRHCDATLAHVGCSGTAQATEEQPS